MALLVNIDCHCGIELLVSHGHGRDNGGLVKRVDHANNGEELSSGEVWQDQDGTPSQIEEKGLSIEQIFDTKKVPPWWEQITFRGIFVSMLPGIMFCIIVMKLNLTTGIIPSLNVSAGLLGFFFIKTWTNSSSSLGY